MERSELFERAIREADDYEKLDEAIPAILAAALPKIGSVLAGAGVKLGGAALKSIGGSLLDVFKGLTNGDDEKGDEKQLRLQVSQLEAARDGNLQYDVNVLIQKAAAQKDSEYAKKIVRALSNLTRL